MLRLSQNSYVQKVKGFSEKYRVYVTPAVLIVGFLLDMLTLNRVDQVFDNIILITHLLIVGTTIALLFAKNTRFGQRLRVQTYAHRIEYLMLFSFGAVFSGSIIFYSKSASFGSSWPFFLILLILMLSTEFQRHYFQRLILQINFYFIALFSYLIVILPVLKKDMGPHMFIASGLLSLFFISFFFLLLYAIDRKTLALHMKKITTGVISLFLLFNLLYFTNIIPPIPLSLKSSGVYHSVYRVSPEHYVGKYEPSPWWNPLVKQSRTVHWTHGEAVYVFSSVFAPTRLNTEIRHVWQYRDPVTLQWVDTSTINLTITGGRDGGFRGYSLKRNLEPGQWRVLIETDRGQKLGQIRFRIEFISQPVLLSEEIL